MSRLSVNIYNYNKSKLNISLFFLTYPRSYFLINVPLFLLKNATWTNNACIIFHLHTGFTLCRNLENSSRTLYCVWYWERQMWGNITWPKEITWSGKIIMWPQDMEIVSYLSSAIQFLSQSTFKTSFFSSVLAIFRLGCLCLLTLQTEKANTSVGYAVFGMQREINIQKI